MADNPLASSRPVDANSSSTSILRSIGPAIVVASVVIGPGSILTCSKFGQSLGYAGLWLLAVIGVLMLGMVLLASRIGAGFDGSICDELASRIGRPLSVLIGLILFFVVAAFQTSNNLAVLVAMEEFLPESLPEKWRGLLVLGLLNIGLVVALFGFRKFYSHVERLMKVFVGLMIAAFAANVFLAKPSLSGIFGGLVPSVPDGNLMLLIPLVATTFSVAGAFYQSYLAKEKGWTPADAKAGMIDTCMGIGAMVLISGLIIVTAAAVLSGKPEVESAADIASQLKPLFGQKAVVLFSCGLLAGAISSFLGNAMIGGAVLSDGFGKGWSIDALWPKAGTAAALLFGMIVALAANSGSVSRVELILAAQAVTVVGGPLLAASLIYLGIVLHKRSPDQLPAWMLIIPSVGMLVTLGLAVRTASIVYDKITAA